MSGGSGLDQAETPVAVLDAQRVRANAHKVADYCSRHRLAWRPHVKTHKSTRVARIQLEAGARGLTVATLREAEVMATLTDDLLLAYPPVGEARLQRLMALPRSPSLTVGLDSAEVLDALAASAVAAGRQVGVLVEMDVGLGRIGSPSISAVADLAERARELEGVRYRGVMFYPGHIRVPAPEQDEPLGKLESLLEELYETLSKRGLDPEVVSGGSSPTLWQSHRIPGLTEIRPGTCIFHDRDMIHLGVCEPGELAYSILTTVVSTAVPGRAVVDAGSKALAKEVLRSAGAGYGLLLDRPEVTVASLSEEHGVLDLSQSDWKPRVGDRVRIVPNHVCVSVNLQDRYLVRDDEGAVEEWAIEARGRGPWGS